MVMRYAVHVQECNANRYPGMREVWDTLGRAGLCEMLTVPVQHCADASAIVLGHGSGWSVVYSGDCRPSDQLVGDHML